MRLPGRVSWLASGAVAIALHGLVWGLLSASQPGKAQRPAQPLATMQVRLLTPPPSAQANARPTQATVAQTMAVEAAQPMRVADQEAQAVPAAISQAPLAVPSTGDDYLPRDVLTRAPMAQGVVQIPYPEGVPDGRVHKARLALYIDETGTVRRVKVINGAELPPPMEEAARLSFMQASFTPGQRHGQSVKSYILIEVEFDASQRMPAPQHVAVSS